MLLLCNTQHCDSGNDMQVLQVKASQSTVKMGVDYDNQYQVDIPITVCCFAHAAVSMHGQGCVSCCDAHVLHVSHCYMLQ